MTKADHRVMIVVAVLMLFGCSRAPQDPPEYAEARQLLNQVLHGVTEYEKTVGPYPDSLAELASALPADFTNSFAAWPPPDPWGTPVIYTKPSETNFEIRAAGPDRQFMTGDDFAVAAFGDPLGMIDIPSNSPPAFSGTSVTEIVEWMKNAKDGTQPEN